MNETASDVVVVGGGISGLAAAWHLKDAGVGVYLLESGPVAGGFTRTDHRNGFLLEHGPFNVIVRDPSFETLLEAFCDDVRVVAASRASRKRYIYRAGRLVALPRSPLGLLTTPLLSPAGRCRLLAGLAWSARAGGDDETIAQAATRRFGSQVAETIISAAVSGIYAGDIHRLSARACFPGPSRVDARARSLVVYGLMSALRSRRKKNPRRWRGLISIDGGMGALSTAIARRLGSSMITGCRAESIRAVGEGYVIACRIDGEATRTISCRNLVIASSAAEAGRLLRPVCLQAAEIVETIESASLAVVHVGYRNDDVSHPLDGFGFLVPQNEPDFPLMGALFANSVFPHHAREGHKLLRVFVGGSRESAAVEQTDAELLATVEGALGDLLGISGKPVITDIRRYKQAIPQYHQGHREKIQRLRGAIAARAGLHLIGNYLDGVSLNDCVRLGAETAEELVQARAGADASRPTKRDPACQQAPSLS